MHPDQGNSVTTICAGAGLGGAGGNGRRQHCFLRKGLVLSLLYPAVQYCLSESCYVLQEAWEEARFNRTDLLDVAFSGFFEHNL